MNPTKSTPENPQPSGSAQPEGLNGTANTQSQPAQQPPPAQPPIQTGASASTPVSPVPASSVTSQKGNKNVIIIAAVATIVLLIVVGIIGSFILTRSDSRVIKSPVSSPGGSQTATSQVNSCGAPALGPEQPSGLRFLDQDQIPAGAELKNLGDDDSIREYCEVQALRTSAEIFLNNLGARKWNEAYESLSTEARKIPLATKIDNWNAEYGRYPSFNLTALSVPSVIKNPEYGAEPCRTKYDKGWSKEIAVGYYSTPQFELNQSTLTSIYLDMVKENGTWKVRGENNEASDAAGIVSGDAFSNAQRDRQRVNPYDCPN